MENIVRLIHLWHVPSYNNPSELQSIEIMVLKGENGDEIHASIKRLLIITYQHLLNEGESYTIILFGVGLNSGYYKPDSHAYKINFLNITKLDGILMLEFLYM
ncbi:DNA topoisomerase 2-beta, partial [Bienertia sinuspersici]